MAAVIPGGNGVFRNTVTIGGQVQATWKRTARAKRIDITVLPLPGWRPTKAVRASVERAFVPYGEFRHRHGGGVRLTWAPVHDHQEFARPIPSRNSW